MQINVTVQDLEAVDLDTVVATRPMQSSRGYGDYDVIDVPMTLGDVLVERLVERLANDQEYPNLKELLKRVREEILREAVKPIVEEAIKAPLQKTNNYGEAIGKETTLREVILDEAKKLLTAPHRASSGRSTDSSLLSQIIREEVGNAFRNELAEEIKVAKEKVRAAIRKEGAAALGVAIESLAAQMKRDSERD